MARRCLRGADVARRRLLRGALMRGIPEPLLNPFPDVAWRAIFAAAAAWFAWQAVRARMGSRPGGSRSTHPLPHVVECGAMIYMLRPSGRVPGVTMPGMSKPGSVTAGNPVLVLILAVFMIGYVLWTTDRLASLSRAGAAGRRGGGQSRPPAGETF